MSYTFMEILGWLLVVVVIAAIREERKEQHDREDGR